MDSLDKDDDDYSKPIVEYPNDDQYFYSNVDFYKIKKIFSSYLTHEKKTPLLIIKMIKIIDNNNQKKCDWNNRNKSNCNDN